MFGKKKKSIFGSHFETDLSRMLKKIDKDSKRNKSLSESASWFEEDRKRSSFFNGCGSNQW